MKQHFISFIHVPKKVLALSLVLAIIIGILGYAGMQQKLKKQHAKISAGLIGGATDIDTDGSIHHLTLGFLAGGRIKTVSVKVGDHVKKGDVLATLDAGSVAGALTEARAAYAIAEANYQKVINGATSTAIDVAKAAVNTATVNLEQAKTQQKLLVENAYNSLLNSNPQAFPTTSENDYTAPTISGTYTLGKEGEIRISVSPSGNYSTFSVSGLTTGSGIVTTSIPQKLGDSGLSIKFPSTTNISVLEWTIAIPNKQASNYLANYNAYQLAQQTRDQVVAQAQATLDQANATLTALVTAARPEDVKVAQAQVDNSYGALQIAEAAYANTTIVAPYDGMITTVAITPGQIALPNALAIELTTDTTLPNNN